MASRTSSTDLESTDWQDSNSFVGAVTRFHATYAMPPGKLKKSQDFHEDVLNRLFKYLGFCAHIKKIGGSYEEVKVVKSEENDDFEFDVMFVMNIPEDCRLEIVELAGRSGYAVLKVINGHRGSSDYYRSTNQQFFAKCLTYENGMCIVDAGKTTAAFFSEFKKWMNTRPVPGYDLRPKQHGTAIQMDVNIIPGQGCENGISYSVDIAPTIEILEGGEVKSYVVKPEKKRAPDSVTWRRLFESEQGFPDLNTHARNVLRSAVHELHKQLSDYCASCKGVCRGSCFVLQAARMRLPMPDDDILKLQRALDERKSNYRLTFINLQELNNSTGKRLVAMNYFFENELEVMPVPEKRDYAWLKFRKESSACSRFNNALKLCYLPAGKYLDIKAASDLLVKELQHIANDLLKHVETVVRRDGPIVRIDVYPEKGNKTLYYCLDIVLAAYVDGSFYVGIPHDYDDIPDKKAWRRSYSFEETTKIQKAPEGLKMVFRVLKALRNTECGLAQLTSYHFKTLLLKQLKTVNWNENIAKILIRVLQHLKVCLRDKELPTHFIPEINLLENMTNACRVNMRDRIDELLRSKTKMFEALNVSSRETTHDSLKRLEMKPSQVLIQSGTVQSGASFSYGSNLPLGRPNVYTAIANERVHEDTTAGRFCKNEAICRAIAMNAQFTADIEQYFACHGICDHIVKTGSTYEDLNIDEDGNIQLEVLVIQTVSELDFAVEKRTDMPGYAWLRFLQGRESSPVYDRVLKHWNILGFLTGTRYLDEDCTSCLIYTNLQKCIADSKYMQGKVKIIRSAPILQMEVYPDSWLFSWGNLFYTVDIIPAYKIGEEIYESRPIIGDQMPDTMTWHRSFALQERQRLCRGSKKVLRVLKVLSKCESDFGHFTSYQLKTVVLYETDANQDWSEFMLGKRLADVLARLEKCLAARSLPHYSSPEINLLSKMPYYTMDHLRDRIQRLRANEREMRKLLQSWSLPTNRWSFFN